MALPELGVGIVYQPGLEPLLEAGTDIVPVLEVEPQTLWYEAPGQPDPYRIRDEAVEAVERLPQTKLIHGVGFPVGGSRPPDERILPPLTAMIEGLGAPWASEHLSFNEAEGPAGPFKTGFLLPPLQTPAGAAAAGDTVRRLAKRLPVPFAFETGVNYLRPRAGDLPDGAFAAAVAERADCGILLDLHNLYVNERNGRQPAREFVEQLPLERVWEIHVAGGFEFEGYWIDAHSGEVPEPLMELAMEVVPRLPNLRALTFELMPDYIPRLGLDGIRDQLAALSRVWELRGTATEAARASVPAVRPSAGGEPSPAEWENALGALVVGREPAGALARELSADPGVGILRKLVEEVRAGMVVQALRLTSRVLTIQLGADGFRSLLEEFWRTTAPELFTASEADGFAAFLAGRELAVPYLYEVLAFERAVVRAELHGENAVVPFQHEPTELLNALEDGSLPESVPAGDFEVVVAVE